MNKKQVYYSLNGEDYDDLETIFDELIADGFKSGTEVEIYEGDAKSFKHSEFVDAEYLIEIMQERAYDKAHEYSEDYLNDLSREKINEFGLLISRWLESNAKPPAFWVIENSRKVKMLLEE